MARSTRAADTKAIHALNEARTEAAMSQDQDALVAMYTKDATLAWPGARAAHGSKAIARAYKRLLEEAPDLRMEFHPETITVAKSCDTATDFGKVVVSERNAAGRKVRTVGKYLSTWTKSYGKWRVQNHTWNTNK